MTVPGFLHVGTDDLLVRVLGRRDTLFAADVMSRWESLRHAIAGSRILIAGAGGSIGAAVVRQLAEICPSALHLVDINENTLVEVVRDLRSSRLQLTMDLRTFSIDFGGEAFARLAAAEGPYDYFLNFSALKHVRAERDPFSLMRMIDVNVRALKDGLACMPDLKHAFSVSTDKSVRPVNLMGATKNLMEKVLFEPSTRAASTARFANVAFSAGSLLEGFYFRLAKRQPLAVPSDIRRYFISHGEAAHLCLLAAFDANHREAYCPRMDPGQDLKTFPAIAREFLASQGYDMLPCASEDEAKARVGEPGTWPVHVAPSDTSGEKEFEEFFAPGESPDWTRYNNVGVVTQAAPQAGAVDGFLATIEAIRRRPRWHREEIVDAIRRAVPEVDHLERHRSLDQKM